MRDRMALAALVAAGVSFVVVLVSPPPKARPKPGGQSAESVWLRVQAEIKAMSKEDSELQMIGERAAFVDERAGRAGGVSKEAEQKEMNELVQMMAGREVARLWPDYRERLKTIKLYEKGKK